MSHNFCVIEAEERLIQFLCLIRHNLVVFRNGELAYQVLPSLVDVIPEARLNLAIYYLKQNDIKKANELMKDVKPTVPSEYILKGELSTNFLRLTF